MDTFLISILQMRKTSQERLSNSPNVTQLLKQLHCKSGSRTQQFPFHPRQCGLNPESCKGSIFFSQIQIRRCFSTRVDLQLFYLLKSTQDQR